MTPHGSNADTIATAKAVRAPLDFEALFETLPSPYMIVDRDLRYVAVNAAYCAVLERRREDLIGARLFDLFPNRGREGRRLRDSFLKVLSTGKQDAIPLIPYPIQAPASRGGGMEMRYWSAVHVPVFDGDGEVYVLQNTVDVTELQTLKQIAYGADAEPKPGEKDVLQRVLQVEEVNRALAEESRGLRELFMQAPGFMAVLTGPDLTFSLANNAYLQLVGHRQVIGKALLEALPEVRDQGFVELLQDVMVSNEPYIARAASVFLQRSAGAALEERFLDFIYQPIANAAGEVWGVFVEGSDVTDRVHAERQQRLLVDELNHRVKNTLATVQAITAQTLKSATDVASFRAAFEPRLISLSATHDLLTATNWRSASLRDVLARELRPYTAEQYDLEGPEVQLAPAQALALGLLVHELATNAVKYGALSQAGGCVRVRWTAEDERLALTWTESGGPTVVAPTRRGFGSRLIERSLTGALGGHAALVFAPEGLRCEVGLPLGE